jgi:hypothetical protein
METRLIFPNIQMRKMLKTTCRTSGGVERSQVESEDRPKMVLAYYRFH